MNQQAIENAAQAVSLTEKLGLARSAKVLVVHADDLGMTHSINEASLRGMEVGVISSASVMPAGPWFPEIVQYARAHPELDFGLHFAVTSERSFYRFGPVASRDRVGSLVDAAGYFHQDWSEAVRAQVQADQIELELRAQLERARQLGFTPSHLDSHQYRLYQSGPAVFEALLRVAQDARLPILLARSWFDRWPYLAAAERFGQLAIDRTVTIEPGISPEKWGEFYLEAIRGLEPGVTELIVHPAFNDPEMQAFGRDRTTWDGAWRQRDYDVLTSDEFRNALVESDVKLMSWRELRAGLRGE